MQIKLPPKSRLFATDYTTHYDQVVIPAGTASMMPIYARRHVNRRWYTLMAWTAAETEHERVSISFEDPHGRSDAQGHIDVIADRTLVMPRPAEHGGNWALYELHTRCPEQIDADPLPMDARSIRFLGFTEDGTERLAVIGSRFYPQTPHLEAYAGSSFMRLLRPTPRVVGIPTSTDGGAVFSLKDGSEMLISLDTGLPCVYQQRQYSPVDPVAYSFHETFDGLELVRK